MPAGESGRQAGTGIHSDQGLRRFATLLREYHDAVRDFLPSPDLEWALRPSVPPQVVCHNDFGPWNLVYDGDVPVGILDWDFAALGPYRNDFAGVPDRGARLEVFADTYGLTSTVGLVDEVHRSPTSHDRARRRTRRAAASQFAVVRNAPSVVNKTPKPRHAVTCGPSLIVDAWATLLEPCGDVSCGVAFSW